MRLPTCLEPADQVESSCGDLGPSDELLVINVTADDWASIGARL
jgi:hypothetical protein